MRDSDDSSEVEPLVPVEQVCEPGRTSALHVTPHHFTRDLKTLEIVAVFVVAFDTQLGNVIEWSKPEFMKEQLKGLEFKAMPSGAHTLDEDMVYLYDAELYGVACYAKVSVDNADERGVRMRSVGVLSQSYHSLHIHKQELSKLVRYILQHPGDYTQLDKYYQMWTGDALVNSTALLSTLNLDYSARHFEELLSTLGRSLFTVWKAMLLQKRIMFYGQPPAEDLCHLVYCANSLMSNSHKLRPNICTPFFFVSIADSDVLSRQVAYIACTTEKVFESKTDIYDVYIDQGNVLITTPRLRSILRCTTGDKLRLAQLYSTLRRPLSCDDEPMTVEDVFHSYFSELTKLISQRLSRLVMTDESRLSARDISAMGLHSSDSRFISELLDSLNMDISVGCSGCDCLPG